MNRLRILVTDGSATYRKLFTQAASELDNCTTVTCVADGAAALERIRHNDYELVVIDVEIPELSLLLKEITTQIPKAFVLVSARPSNAGDELCTRALANGAADYLIKPIHSSYSDNFDVIKRKMAGIFKALDEKHEKKTEPADQGRSKSINATNKTSFKPGILLIASSTGGPMALEKILSRLGKGFPVPILIVQHMLLQFTETLAQNLDQKTLLRVKVAENRETIEAGVVYIAPGGTHMKLDKDNKILLDRSPPIHGVRPAADALFESVAESFACAGVLAVILTGMGRDGEKGLSMLKEKQDCFCLAQSEETCVVYGMPRAAIESGFADRILDLDEIPLELERMVRD